VHRQQTPMCRMESQLSGSGTSLRSSCKGPGGALRMRVAAIAGWRVLSCHAHPVARPNTPSNPGRCAHPPFADVLGDKLATACLHVSASTTNTTFLMSLRAFSTFYNSVAELLCKAYPGRWLGACHWGLNSRLDHCFGDGCSRFSSAPARQESQVGRVFQQRKGVQL
jgi:hypothetical protein